MFVYLTSRETELQPTFTECLQQVGVEPRLKPGAGIVTQVLLGGRNPVNGAISTVAQGRSWQKAGINSQSWE